jgi:hypothetical protein
MCIHSLAELKPHIITYAKGNNQANAQTDGQADDASAKQKVTRVRLSHRCHATSTWLATMSRYIRTIDIHHRRHPLQAIRTLRKMTIVPEGETRHKSAMAGVDDAAPTLKLFHHATPH